ncbi:phospholipase D-like domain-containing protein [Synechococcus sp. UW140]|uniref:phospholipase D-like domain-containing protein n=1 Tax=Synechococcus sp. UW140 TaxID=368503 RepID=UPI0031382B11
MVSGITSLKHHQTLLVMPEDGVAALQDFIAGASQELRLKQFKLESEAIELSLQQAHARGVKVRVMLNPHTSGGDRWNDSAFERLQAWGIEVAWSSDAFAVTHEKSIVVDNSAALISTFNLSDKYFTETRDYGIITYAQAAIDQVIAGFEADWQRAFFAPDLNVGLVWSSFHSRGQMARLIDSAQQRIWVQHPKFVDSVILERLVAASNRGVKVRILCGGKHGISDWDIFDTFSSLRLLERAGVKVRRQKHLKLHAKLIIIDQLKALIGSMNIDRSAFDIRRELGIETDAPEVLARCVECFSFDWKQASKYSAPDPLDPSMHNHGELPPDPNFIHD